MMASLTDEDITSMCEDVGLAEQYIAGLRERNVEPTRLRVIAVATDRGHDNKMVEFSAKAADIQLGG